MKSLWKYKVKSLLFSSSSLDDAEDSKKDKQDNKHNNKLPQVNLH